MIISEVALKGFRCFGPTPTKVGLDDGLTVFIGDNGSGKTALMLALLRVLGRGGSPSFGRTSMYLQMSRMGRASGP